MALKHGHVKNELCSTVHNCEYVLLFSLVFDSPHLHLFTFLTAFEGYGLSEQVWESAD